MSLGVANLTVLRVNLSIRGSLCSCLVNNDKKFE